MLPSNPRLFIHCYGCLVAVVPEHDVLYKIYELRSDTLLKLRKESNLKAS